MEIGEVIAVLIDTPQKCPFCDSKASPRYETKEMTNDAVVLAKNSGGMPKKMTPNPESTEDYFIYEKYWKSEGESQIVMSPHHLLPGNASLARCPEILKWMAGTTSVKKQEHSKSVKLKIKKILAKAKRYSSAQRGAKTKALVAQEFPPKPLKESPDGKVVFAFDGKRVDSHSKPVKDKYVTGKINFDVNDGENCVWLPSHCAIENWSAMVGEAAWHMDQKPTDENPITFEVAYAYNTMKKTGVQFHDAHPAYSEEVIEELKKLDASLKRLADKCLDHDNTTSKKGGPYRAPEQLTPALHKLADLCRRQLKLAITTPAAPWHTSDLALKVKALVKGPRRRPARRRGRR